MGRHGSKCQMLGIARPVKKLVETPGRTPTVWRDHSLVAKYRRRQQSWSGPTGQELRERQAHWGTASMQTLIPLAEKIAARLQQRGETIAVSESSTGGLISAALLAVPGASAYFLGGAVVYTR